MLSYKYIGKAVPMDVRNALDELIKKFDLDYADNFRYSPLDDAQGMVEFEHISNGGCCGSFEHEVADSLGRKWMVGCNYGH